MDLIRHVDPRLQGALEAELRRRAHEPVDGLPRGLTVVLAGHRAAGKSTLLPHVASVLGRHATDLDAELEARAGRSIRSWFAEDPASFRAAERDVFASLPAGEVVAVGGGFLANHAQALAGCVAVLVPITWQTFVDRLTADTSRPRLMPEVPLYEELESIWAEREDKHRRAKTMPFVDFLLALSRAPRARRVVTLPPDAHPVEFAWSARHQGADLLEVRTDLTPLEVDVGSVARALPLLVAERAGVAAPTSWKRHASLLDGEGGSLRSHHAERPLSTAEALAVWDAVPAAVLVKHVEPLGPLADAPRLFETQRALVERFGADRVTVLATGPLALPFRALLAEHNALDYLALTSGWSAAVGQRLLADAVRSARRALHDPMRERLAILGHPVAHSRSPRLHVQPFDRLEVPPDTDVPALLAALWPHYRGFAVTNPFKKAVARAVEASTDAVNTLVRAPRGWRSLNSDVVGAKAALAHLSTVATTRAVTVLGDGGVSHALRVAAGELGLALDVKRRDGLTGVERGAVVWTWPPHVEAPPGLRFEAAHVGVIAYGAPARTIASKVRALGGIVVRLGPRWFIAQARQQRAAWESAT